MSRGHAIFSQLTPDRFPNFCYLGVSHQKSEIGSDRLLQAISKEEWNKKVGLNGEQAC